VVVDPSHPVAQAVQRGARLPKFPSFRDPANAFSLRLFPVALLQPQDEFAALAWPPRGERARAAEERGRVHMPVAMIIGKQAVHKHATVRSTIAKKLKLAASLVVIRGAEVKMETSGNSAQDKIVFDAEKAGADKWLMKGMFCGYFAWHSYSNHGLGWIYVFLPTLEIYQMPYTELIRRLSPALAEVKRRASVMQATWDEGGTVTRGSVPSGVCFVPQSCLYLWGLYLFGSRE
jgi:hypothetical protein